MQRLAAQEPEMAATGHGLPMRREELTEQLAELARDFDETGGAGPGAVRAGSALGRTDGVCHNRTGDYDGFDPCAREDSGAHEHQAGHR